jgi:caa(3)-type oxidase subunit IV
VAWVALCLLTLASFGSHGLDLGALGTAIALGIAVVKACIVLFAFMHLAHESVSIRFLVLLAALWVVLVCAGIVLDVAFR